MKEFTNTKTTFDHIQDLLPEFLLKMQMNYVNHPKEIFARWPKIIGEKFAKWTRPVSYKKNILTIKVTSSVLYSILVQQEKQRLLRQLKEQFPKACIKNIVFQIG